MDKAMKPCLFAMMLSIGLIPRTCTYVDSTCPASCSCSLQNRNQNIVHLVSCRNIFPLLLPRGTNIVRLSNMRVSRITEDMFDFPTWRNVTDLIIADDSKEKNYLLTSIGKNAFRKLVSLQRLKLSGLELKDIHRCAFRGLRSLKILDVRESLLQTDALLESMWGRHVLPNLEEFYFSAEDHYCAFNVSSSVLLGVFKPKPIKVLHLIGVKFKDFDPKSFNESFPLLQFINISRTSYQVSLEKESSPFIMPPNLRIIDISQTSLIRIPTPPPSRILYFKDYGYAEHISEFIEIREFYVRKAIHFKLALNGSVFELKPNVSLKLQILNIEDNGIVWLNCTLIGASFHFSLQKLYLGFNGLQYITPPFIQAFRNLRLLHLSHNDLYFMSNYAEFSLLLSKSYFLNYINLSANKLRYIPSDMFINNSKLEVIDLSNNNLEYIQFQIDHLAHLILLSVENNKILTLGETTIAILNSLFVAQRGLTNNETRYKIVLEGNPFECSCKALKTVRFLVRTKLHISKRTRLKCNLDGDVVAVNEDAVKKTVALCYRPSVIVCSVVISVFLTLTVCAVVAFLLHRRRQQRLQAKVKRLIKRYKSILTEENYLVFFGYSSDDYEFATYVYSELERRLREDLQTEKDLVCCGDCHFTPGKYIIENIVKHVEQSFVIIFLISTAFCQSDWCKFETMVAVMDKKPVILMFKEYVPQRKLPTVLRKLYKQYVRVFWKEQSDGSVNVIPKWENLCRTILEHASKTSKDIITAQT